MTLPAPLLDDRRFEDLLRDLQQLIPRYTPELAPGQDGWTDWNESDPGTTLLQLWAHLAETILYRVNRIPDRAHVKFLELVGLQLRPARAANVDLTFTPQPGFAPPARRDGIIVPRRTQVRAQPPDGGDPLTFETEEGLDLVRAELASVQVADGGAFTDVTGLNGPAGTAFRPLGWVPQPGNALYLGFAPPDPPITGRVFPRAMRIRVFLPPAADDALRCDSDAPTPAPPVTLEWEYRRSDIDTRWRRLETFEDGTLGLTRGGYLLLAGPAEIDPVDRLGRVAEPRLWLRCRLSGGAYPAGRRPEIDFLRTNTVRAENLATVRDEVVGTSEGHPSQTFALRKSPMQPASLTLQVEESGEFLAWERRDDLLASAPGDRHYTIDGASGTVAFGDGRRGRIPVAGARVVAKEYRHGASAAGNVAAGLVTSLATTVPGVQEVVNLRAAVGGDDVQAIDELRRDAPAELRTLRRAVTGADYAALARQVGTVARAVALPLAHPDHRNVDVPGAVTVVVVPDNDDAAPRPSPELLESVCRHLDTARTIATELHVVGPRYHEIKVTAQVEAEPYASFDTVRQAVAGAINAALDPLGRPPPPLPGEEAPAEEVRGPGREFGRDFPPTSLFGIILDVDDVAAVPFLQVELDGSPWDEPSRPIVLDPDELLYGAADPDELLYGAADHEITVVAFQERTNGSAP